MKRIKVLKAYLIIWLFILYVVYTNAELLGIFFMATVIFSTAILGLLAVGTLYQIVSGFHIMMLGGTFGALAYKKTGYEFYIRSIDSLLPANIAHMLQSRKSKQTMFFTQEGSRASARLFYVQKYLFGVGFAFYRADLVDYLHYFSDHCRNYAFVRYRRCCDQPWISNSFVSLESKTLPRRTDETQFFI
ncbi:MAG: hypothetical protein OA34_10300 [Sulfurospirillum sp. MES]|nr:MAG: hypothetical protein OA34_10300 [Sulfurospirillum sp. MES]